MSGEVTIRPALRSDAGALAALFAAQREHLAPWDPRREHGFFTRAGQRARLAGVERDRAAGTAYRFVILEAGELAGEVAITNVVLRSFQSANLGYWVAGERCGRGVATAAVAAICEFAFRELDAHRRRVVRSRALPAHRGAGRQAAGEGGSGAANRVSCRPAVALLIKGFSSQSQIKL